LRPIGRATQCVRLCQARGNSGLEEGSESPTLEMMAKLVLVVIKRGCKGPEAEIEYDTSVTRTEWGIFGWCVHSLGVYTRRAGLGLLVGVASRNDFRQFAFRVALFIPRLWLTGRYLSTKPEG